MHDTTTPGDSPRRPPVGRRAATPASSGLTIAVALIGALIAVPVVSVGVNAAAAGTGDTWAHLASTLLPEYVMATLALIAGVGIGVVLLGVGAAWLVTHHDFPLRAGFEWALVLPLAMPAYVMAYAYADLLQFAGPVQTMLRETFGWRRGDYWFPDVRSLGGAMTMLAAVLYPYVYLLARIAFLERGGSLIETGRALGLGPLRAFWRVSLPMARPAIAAGATLALMETLADYGTVSHFGVQTFTTGIYRAWFSLGDRSAAAQLSLCLLGFVVVVLLVERATRGRARYAATGTRRHPPRAARLAGWRAATAIAASTLPIVFGFALPVAYLLRLGAATADAQFGARFIGLAGNSILVSVAAAVVAVLLALAFAYARRVEPNPVTRAAHGIGGLGYALPGSVIAVGALIPFARLDDALAQLLKSIGFDAGLLITGTIAALVYACVVRFLATALQTVDASLARVTPHMDDAARSLGLAPAQALARVHLPLVRRGLLTAGLLVFMDTMKELPATLVMRPFDFDTLATHAYQLARDERLAEASAASIAIVLVGLLPLVVLSRQIRADRHEAAGGSSSWLSAIRPGRRRVAPAE